MPNQISHTLYVSLQVSRTDISTEVKVDELSPMARREEVENVCSWVQGGDENPLKLDRISESEGKVTEQDDSIKKIDNF